MCVQFSGLGVHLEVQTVLVREWLEQKISEIGNQTQQGMVHSVGRREGEEGRESEGGNGLNVEKEGGGGVRGGAHSRYVQVQ